ncbi:hypothetical protein LEL_09393 [Akanthomyces lecanii RCEF 1005]|uniref:Methyltransferase-like protein 13 n=1 Tax=Akanthomyces lecanii RCEF 1005 TaxID=1081108 RepID=A0A162JLR6_CORDF|nr:hypothetical protein LEL_09393 [Akanthomyces lecanii RCEF 1005]
MAADFEQQSYWHERFRSETAFEWLLSSSDFLSLVDPLLASLDRSSAAILHVGSGTSDLHNHLRRRGFLGVTNVDYEPLAACRGRELERRAFGDVRLRYAVADATRLPQDLASESDSEEDEGVPGRSGFQLVLDKSTCDAISCGGEDALRKMCDSVYQCLRPDGAWIALSFSADRFQLSDLPFHVEVLSKVQTPKSRATDPDIFYWCYCLRPR